MTEGGENMCMGSSSAPSVPKADPVPTAVQSADVQADKGSTERKERRRGGRSSTMTSTDRDTILGALSGRNTLG